MSDKETLIENQVNADNDGPDLTEALAAAGIGSEKGEADKSVSLDASDGELPSVQEVEDMVISDVMKASESEVETIDNVNLDDLEVEFDEEDNVVVKDKKESMEASGDKKAEEPNKEAQEATEVQNLSDYVKTLPEDIKVKHKVDGEEVEISLKEAISKTMNEYSGHEAVGKRFTELDKREKALYSEKQDLISKLDEVGQQFEVDNLEGAFEALGKITGRNTPGFLVKEKLISSLLPEIQRRASLTNEELKHEYLQSQNKYYQELNESEERQRNEKASQTALEQTVSSIRETHKINTEEWNEAFAELDKSIPEGEDITLKMVKEAVLNKREASTVTSKVDSLLDGIEGVTEESHKYMADLIRKHPEFTDEQLKAIVEEATKPTESVDNKKEIEKSLNKKVKQTTLSSETPDEDQINMDRIMDILESDD